MRLKVTIDVMGWAGAALLLFAYGMVSAERWRGGAFKFQLSNIIGSVFLIANTVYYGAFPSAEEEKVSGRFLWDRKIFLTPFSVFFGSPLSVRGLFPRKLRWRGLAIVVSQKCLDQMTARKVGTCNQ